VSVTSGSTTHSFVYDPDGRLIGEYDSSGSPVAETIWLSPEVANANEPFGGDDGVGGYAPLALVTGSGAGAAIYWVHANHIGVPLVTTDAAGAVATPAATPFSASLARRARSPTSITIATATMTPRLAATSRPTRSG